MKLLRFYSTLVLSLLLLLVIYTSQSSARFLPSKQGKEPRWEEAPTEMKENIYINELMGTEQCQRGDEECIKRRIIAEAHLDYIYTQQNKT